MNPAPNLFFVGPMGAGKSTIGRRTAELLGLPFFDLDHEVEEHSGASIPLIFDVEGEAGFRRRESAALADFAARTGIALATGGGAVLAQENRARLARHGTVVYLRARPEDLYERVRHDRNRPLLATANPLARLRTLFEERDPLYREIADLVVETGEQSPQSLARGLLDRLETEWKASA